jgi:hypothetical protein
MDNSQQNNPIRITLDELFKKVFPGLVNWIEKIYIVKEEPITAEKHSSDR